LTLGTRKTAAKDFDDAQSFSKNNAISFSSTLWKKTTLNNEEDKDDERYVYCIGKNIRFKTQT
jgi:hypothetical protein